MLNAIDTNTSIALIQTLTLAAAIGLMAPVILMLAAWYASAAGPAAKTQLPVFKTGGPDLTGAHGPSVPSIPEVTPVHPLDADATERN